MTTTTVLIVTIGLRLLGEIAHGLMTHQNEIETRPDLEIQEIETEICHDHVMNHEDPLILTEIAIDLDPGMILKDLLTLMVINIADDTPRDRGMIRVHATWNVDLGHGILLKVINRLGGGMHHDPGMILGRRHRRRIQVKLFL